MVLRRVRNVLLAAGTLLLAAGIVINLAPLGKSDAGGKGELVYCGPMAVVTLMKRVGGATSTTKELLKQVKEELAWWEYIPERVPFIGGATFPWGIVNVAKKEGLNGKVEVGQRGLYCGHPPFIALVLNADRKWHYVTVLDTQESYVLTNNGLLSTDKFLQQWRWSYYWGYTLISGTDREK